VSALVDEPRVCAEQCDAAVAVAPHQAIASTGTGSGREEVRRRMRRDAFGLME